MSTTFHSEVGDLNFRPCAPGPDHHMLHEWITHPRSRFWGALDATPEDVYREYRRIAESAGEEAVIVSHAGTPIALFEFYRVTATGLSDIIDTAPGDWGLHLLVAPPRNGHPPRRAPIHGLTDCIFSAGIRYLFEIQRASRIIVEPDVRNDRIIGKNLRGGFTDLDGGTVVPYDGKNARIQVCTPAAFAMSPLGPKSAVAVYAVNSAHLSTHGRTAERQLIAKLIREFAHERLIRVQEDAPGRFHTRLGGIEVHFRARRHRLEHLSIEPESLHCVSGEELSLLGLVSSAAGELGLSDGFVFTYLEELAATLNQRARALARRVPSNLVLAGRAPAEPDETDRVPDLFQLIEAAMFEGHPGFLANAGRGGLGELAARRYAPECHSATPLFWLAARREFCTAPVIAELQDSDFFWGSIDPASRETFKRKLTEAGHDPVNFLPLPLHPWQWDNRVISVFSADLLTERLIPLGHGQHLYQPQQSLRTFFNRSEPSWCYVKTSVAVRNMGFVRGLSPEYMSTTPAVNDWLATTLGTDPEFHGYGATLLHEVAAIGYQGDAYHGTPAPPGTAKPPARKILAALWRSSPLANLPEDCELATLAAVLHVDSEGSPLVRDWIQRSELTAATWVRALLTVYLLPVLHALAAHSIVFMPHGENVILRLRGGTPVGTWFKDLGEEVAVLDSATPLPPEIERIRADHGEMTGEQRALSIQTDVLDGVLRHLAALLDDHEILNEAIFWKLCRELILEYEDRHPGTLSALPLLSPDFPHSCLNRLQLRDPEEMVNIGDLENSLIYVGRMANPLATPSDLRELE